MSKLFRVTLSQAELERLFNSRTKNSCSLCRRYRGRFHDRDICVDVQRQLLNFKEKLFAERFLKQSQLACDLVAQNCKLIERNLLMGDVPAPILHEIAVRLLKEENNAG